MRWASLLFQVVAIHLLRGSFFVDDDGLVEELATFARHGITWLENRD